MSDARGEQIKTETNREKSVPDFIKLYAIPLMDMANSTANKIFGTGKIQRVVFIDAGQQQMGKCWFNSDLLVYFDTLHHPQPKKKQLIIMSIPLFFAVLSIIAPEGKPRFRRRTTNKRTTTTKHPQPYFQPTNPFHTRTLSHRLILIMFIPTNRPIVARTQRPKKNPKLPPISPWQEKKLIKNSWPHNYAALFGMGKWARRESAARLAKRAAPSVHLLGCSVPPTHPLQPTRKSLATFRK